MSWYAFSPENVARHPSRFVGPNVAGAIVQAVETGILINQSIRFWGRATNERPLVKSVVAFVSLGAAFQSAIAFYNTWRVIVLGFGNWILVVDLQWYDKVQPALNCLMAAPVQAFLIWRCWNAMRRSWIVLIPLLLLLLATVIANTVITIHTITFPVTEFLLEPTQHLPPAFVTAFVLSALLDVLITALMLWFLCCAKAQVVSRRFSKVISHLLVLLWEAAIPPCVCAIAACAIYLSMSLENLWDIFLQSILGKLYVISLFVTLNGRADLQYSSDTDVPDPSAGLTRYWRTGANIRVNLTNVVDQSEQFDNELTPTAEHFKIDCPSAGGDSLWEKRGCGDPGTERHHPRRACDSSGGTFVDEG